MIEVGTKLKSVRNGDIVEVLAKTPENMKVRLADGTEKVLTAGTVARWYDEVKDTKAATEKPVKKTVKEVYSKKEVKKVAEILKETAAPKVKKESSNSTSVEPLSLQLKEHLNKIGCTVINQVAYNKIASKSGETIAHLWFLKNRVRLHFKRTKLQEADKSWMAQLPKTVKTFYNYEVNVADPTLMKRCLDLLDRING